MEIQFRTCVSDKPGDKTWQTGHVIDSHGVRPDRKNVDDIMNIQPPQNMKEVKRILGMVHYLGQDMPGLAEITRPLNDLLKAGTAWTWSHAQEQALARIKQLLSEAPVLSFFDMNKPTNCCKRRC